ncbi:MAG: hypothetical protein L3J75_17850 [Methylococcaceae bacterium]|nr:hypothetical protein [Methylococcaceae bacterium]
MKSSSLCTMACIDGADIEIPEPGSATIDNLRFHIDQDRALFISMVGNTQLKISENNAHKIAIVGLSPADTQLQDFISHYNNNGSYEEAALASAFKGLQKDIIKMLNGLGVSKYLGFNHLPEDTDINRSGIFLTTSLIKCASLTQNGSSSDFDPWKYPSNIKCIKNRFVPEMLSNNNSNITHILVLGNKAKKALKEKILINGRTMHSHLEKNGKHIAYIPHPSGANRESVDLAILENSEFPSKEQHQNNMWNKYKVKQTNKGKKLANESSYKKTRGSRWESINQIRELFKA